jgi:hypothetical protein
MNTHTYTHIFMQYAHKYMYTHTHTRMYIHVYIHAYAQVVGERLLYLPSCGFCIILSHLWAEACEPGGTPRRVLKQDSEIQRDSPPNGSKDSNELKDRKESKNSKESKDGKDSSSNWGDSSMKQAKRKEKREEYGHPTKHRREPRDCGKPSVRRMILASLVAGALCIAYAWVGAM